MNEQKLRYGFIGVGDMGGPMARRMIEGGLPMMVYDLSERAMAALTAIGATAASSIAEMAASCDVIFTCLAKPSICLSVAQEIAAAAQKRVSIHVEMSTVGVKGLREVQKAHEASGVVLVDCPISGGPKAVAAGQLTCIVSGPDAEVARLRPALGILAGRIFHLNETPGVAQAMKVANNLLAATNLAVTGEVVRLAEAAGIDPALAIDVINVSTGRNRASEILYPSQILTENYAQGARLDILAKDTDLATEAATLYGTRFDMGRAVRDTWRAATEAGFGAEDITAIYKFIGTPSEGTR